MENLPPILLNSLHVAAQFKYVIVFLASIIEGPITMIASGFLLHLGFFTFWPTFTSLILGDLVGDIGWYYIGYFYAEKFIKRFGKFFGLTLENFEKVKEIFSKHHRKIMFFSKLTMGFGLAIYILMVAGATKIKMKTYLIINTIGEFFYVAALIYIGAMFGKLYNNINEGFRSAFVVFLVVFLVILLYNVQKYLRSRTLKS